MLRNFHSPKGNQGSSNTSCVPICRVQKVLQFLPINLVTERDCNLKLDTPKTDYNLNIKLVIFELGFIKTI